MLLDISNIRGEHSSLDTIEELQNIISNNGGKKYNALRVQYNELISLGITTSLSVALQHIKSLTASHNRISTLQGIEYFPCLEFLDLSHNALRVLDSHSTTLLRRLRRLRKCDFSHNELRLVDLEISSRSSNNIWNDMKSLNESDSVVANFVTAAPMIMEELTIINLSHNQLIEIPDLRCMPALEEINLEYNRIESIIDLDNHLPLLSLTSLLLGYNALHSLHAIIPVTVLAETLKFLTVRGNPFMHENNIEKIGIRPWLLFLLPRLESIDELLLTNEERQVTLLLFRQHGELSYEAMEVMNHHNSSHLEIYLQKFIPLLTARSKSSEISSSLLIGNKKELPIVNVSYSNSPATSLGGMAARLPTNSNIGVNTTNITSRPASVEFTLQVFQRKLTQLSNVMEVLWKESISRRKFATIILQKHARGFLTRWHLPPSIKKNCARIRENLRRTRYRSMSIQQKQIVDNSNVIINPTNITNSTTSITNEAQIINNNNKIDYNIIMKQFWSIESAINQLSIEMNDFRRIYLREKQNAAIIIQKYYRGYRDRKHWRRLKECYDEFILSLRPNVVKLQCTCRGYLSRVKFAHYRIEVGKTRLLRELKSQVAELYHFIHEIRKDKSQEEVKEEKEEQLQWEEIDRNREREKAMEEIISRRTASLIGRLPGTERNEENQNS